MRIWLSRLLRKLGPSWLVKDEMVVPAADGTQERLEVDSRLLFTSTMILSALAERARAGILARFPGNGTMPESALRPAGRDRGIKRGPNEPADVYELRLVGAVDKQRTSGNAWRLMEQVRAYCYPHAVRVRVWTERGKVYTHDRDGTLSVVRTTDWDWDGSDLDEAWNRFWLLIYVTTDTTPLPWQRITWGQAGLLWGNSQYTWGSTASPGDVAALRSIVEDWRGTAQCKHIMLCFDDTEFDPTDGAPPLPDGTWGPWSKNVGGVQVPTRSPTALYWPGTRGPAS